MVQGCLDYVNGRIFNGFIKAISGITLSGFGMNRLELDEESYAKHMQSTFALSAGAVMVQGAGRFVNGLSETRTIEILKGGFQTAVGILGIYGASRIDLEMYKMIHFMGSLVLATAISGAVIGIGYAAFELNSNSPCVQNPNHSTTQS